MILLFSKDRVCQLFRQFARAFYISTFYVFFARFQLLHSFTCLHFGFAFWLHVGSHIWSPCFATFSIHIVRSHFWKLRDCILGAAVHLFGCNVKIATLLRAKRYSTTYGGSAQFLAQRCVQGLVQGSPLQVCSGQDFPLLQVCVLFWVVDFACTIVGLMFHAFFICLCNVLTTLQSVPSLVISSWHFLSWQCLCHTRCAK